jgi:Hint domain
MAKTISTTIHHSVIYYANASSNPLSIASNGAILATASGSYYALSLVSGLLWTVVNAGTISASAGLGLHASAASVINTGLISAGGRYGVRLEGDSNPADAVVINSGSIINSYAAPVPGLYAAIYLRGRGEITNQAGGLISGTGNGVMTYVFGTMPVTVTNAGTIAGGFYGISSAGQLTVTNSGLITGGTAGVLSVAFGGGTGSDSLTNVAGGLIEGGRYGVTVAGSGTLTNAGTISGGYAAVQFGYGYSDRLIDAPGAMFVGKVSGGNAIGSTAVSTLELASGASTGTLAGLGVGTGFYDFAAITVDPGANWSLTGASTLAAGATLTDAGNLTLASALAGTGTIAFAGSGVVLTVEPGDAPAPTLAGFNNNTLALLGVHETISGFAGGKLTLGGSSAITLSIAGSYSTANFHAAYANGQTVLTACYAEGTAIETGHGPVPVQHLRPGMHLRTASGALRPLRWLGHRRHTDAEVAARDELRPVRLAAGCLGNDLPTRDLRLSPEHALLLDGVLVPAIQLLGLPGITQEPPEAVTYYHVELDTHDAILAEGIAAETYIEEAAGAVFDNAGTRPPPPLTIPCAPRIVAGPVLAAIRRRLGGTDAALAAGPVAGNIESTAPGRIGGWAFQPDTPDAPVRLLIEADGVPCASVLANGFRFDLRRAGLGHGNAAFSYTGPIPHGTKSIAVTRESDRTHIPGSPFPLAA